MVTKMCKVCGETKEAVRGAWVVNKGKFVGRTCLACASAKTKELQSTPEGKAKKKEAQQRYYTVPENRERNNAANKRNSKLYYADPVWRARENERCCSWQKCNVEMVVSAHKRRYAKITATPEGRAMLSARALAWYHADPDGKAKNSINSRAWRKLNPGKVAIRQLMRRTSKTQRTPKWLTDDDRANMDASYAMAKWLSYVVGVPYVVDHVVPLNGKIVSGLHVPNNLSVIRRSVNSVKGKKWAP